VSETGAKNQGEPTVSVGSIRVECSIIRPLCVNVGNMLSPRYPDTAGAMSLSAGRSFSQGALLIMPLADPEGKKQKKRTDKASLRSGLALWPPTGKHQNVQSTENMCPCCPVNR